MHFIRILKFFIVIVIYNLLFYDFIIIDLIEFFFLPIKHLINNETTNKLD